MPDILFATPAAAWLSERCLPERPLGRVSVPDGAVGAAGMSVPVLFGRPTAEGRAWEAVGSGLAVAVDLLGGAFFMLARVEEVVSRRRDAHDRFPASASIVAAEGLVERPIVDEYVDLLWGALQALWPGMSRPATTFRLRPTHDIDVPWAAYAHGWRAVARTVTGDLGRRRDVNLALRRLRAAADGHGGRMDRDPFNTFDFLMDASERHGLTSTFYFMAGNEPGDYDYRYRITDPPFRAILRRIHERGHEIGLHGSYISHGSPARLEAEFKALTAACRAAGVEQDAWGIRQHYLRMTVPDTWRSQVAAGLAHDSTLGFAELAGFRAGTCREYPLFDVVAGRPLGLRERPLIVMDGTVLEYMGFGLEEAAAHIRRLAATCRRHAGDCVLLYHNNTLAGARLKLHYEELLAELSQPG